MNIIALTGRLTHDPELKTTPSGKSVCTFGLAVNRPRVKDTVDFIDVVAWQQSAEYLCKYGFKGAPVSVVGALTSRKWTDKDGKNRVSFEVSSNDISILQKRDATISQQTAITPPPAEANNAPAADYIPISDDDLPF